MDRFYLVAIMLFAMQHDMVDYSVVDVIKLIDKERGIMSRIDFLKIVFEVVNSRFCFVYHGL